MAPKRGTLRNLLWPSLAVVQDRSVACVVNYESAPIKPSELRGEVCLLCGREQNSLPVPCPSKTPRIRPGRRSDRSTYRCNGRLFFGGEIFSGSVRIRMYCFSSKALCLGKRCNRRVYTYPTRFLFFYCQYSISRTILVNKKIQ